LESREVPQTPGTRREGLSTPANVLSSLSWLLPEATHMMQIPQHLDQRSPTTLTWLDRAACVDEDPELFFPDGNTGQALLQTEQAKAVCHRCEVAAACLKWALESGQDYGVWGGTSEDERRLLKGRSSRVRRAS